MLTNEDSHSQGVLCLVLRHLGNMKETEIVYICLMVNAIGVCVTGHAETPTACQLLDAAQAVFKLPD